LAAFVAAFALSACSSAGNWPAISSAPDLNAKTRQGVEIQITVLHPAKCPEGPWYACVDISPGGSGPYVKWSACDGSKCSSQYDLVPTDIIDSTKSGLEAKNLRSTWTPKEGNPTEQQISEIKPVKKSKHVQFVDITYACYVHDPKSCSSTYEVGLIPQ